MRLVVNNSALLLDRWQTVELVDAAGTTATLDRGCVWITMAGDRRDIVLGSGQSFKVDRNGKTLLHAEIASTVRIASGPKRRPFASLRALWERARAASEKWAVREIDHPHALRYY